jgi:hypothetical protein
LPSLCPIFRVVNTLRRSTVILNGVKDLRAR